MATNFGTNIAINAYKCICARDSENVITYSRVFCGRAIQRRHFWLQGSNGCCHGNQFLAKISKYVTKSPQLQLYAPYPCRVWFCHRVCAVKELIRDTPVHKGQRGVTMATNFGTKIAINAFLRDTTGMWLCITWVFRGRPIQIRHLWLQGFKGRCYGNEILAKIG